MGNNRTDPEAGSSARLSSSGKSAHPSSAANKSNSSTKTPPLAEGSAPPSSNAANGSQNHSSSAVQINTEEDRENLGSSNIYSPDDQSTIITQRSPLAHDAATERLIQGRIEPGDMIGPYELLDLIGGGGMGQVYRALDTTLDRIVAIKLLPVPYATGSDTLTRFQNEARLSAQLNHENIVQVYHIGEDDGLNYIVYEYIEGDNIRSLIRRSGVLPLIEALAYTIEIAQALTHVSDKGIVHRDVKPSNILVTQEGRVKLIDLGLARLEKVTDDSAGDLTASGTTLGTFDYISPEQARDPRTADVRSDIYSLGCTFFYMLAGAPPFPEGTVLQKLLQHQGEPPPDIHQFRPELPVDIAPLLEKMLAKDPNHRYANPQDLIEDLLKLGRQVGLRSTPGGQRYLVPRPRESSFLHRHLSWMMPVAILLCSVVLLDRLWSEGADIPPAVGIHPLAENGEIDSGNPSADSELQPNGGQGSATPGEATNPLTLSNVVGRNGNGTTDSSGNNPTVAPPNEDSPLETTGSPNTTTVADPTESAPTDSTATGNTGGQPADPRSITNPSEVNPSTTGVVADTTPASPTITRPSDGSAGDHTPGTSTGNNPGGGTSPVGPSTVASTDPGSVTDDTNPGVSDPATPVADDPTPPAAPQTRTLIVQVDSEPEDPESPTDDSLTGIEDRFTSLRAACTAAENGDTIELRYNGSLAHEPIVVLNKRLTIRAADGFRPVIEFHPTSIDDVKYRRNMITVTSGHLTIADTLIRFIIPRDIAAESWSLFDVGSATTIELRRCRLTIFNESDTHSAYHRASFFQIHQTTASASDMPTTAAKSTSLELTDCLVRGEAIFVEYDGSNETSVFWDNGLLATTECLLQLDDGDRLGLAPATGRIDIQLRQLTVDAENGLYRMSRRSGTPSTNMASPTVFRCFDSIVRTAPDSPLIEVSLGPNDTLDDETLRQLITWTGRRVIHADTRTFWQAMLGPVTTEPSTQPTTFDFDRWFAYWNDDETIDPVVGSAIWETPPSSDHPMNQRTADDYRLRPHSTASPNPATNSAGDGGNVGLRTQRMPIELLDQE